MDNNRASFKHKVSKISEFLVFALPFGDGVLRFHPDLNMNLRETATACWRCLDFADGSIVFSLPRASRGPDLEVENVERSGNRLKNGSEL